MLEKHSTEGRRNTYRRRQSGIALLFSGILLTILAGAVVVISTVLQQVQREVLQLQGQVDALVTDVRSGEIPDRGAESLQEWVATLRSEVAEARLETTKAITLARDEARADRAALRKSLAHVLHAHGATAEEILSVVGDLSPAERARLQSELAAIKPTPPATGSGNGADPVTPSNGSSTPDSSDRVTPPDSAINLSGEDPPMAIIVEPDEPDSGGPDPGEPDSGEPDPGEPDSGEPDSGEPDPGEPDPEAVDTTDHPEAGPSATTYLIKPGDTLSGIARSLGVSETALRKANGIRNPNLIKVGATLKVPAE